jgi:hypothetical protein
VRYVVLPRGELDYSATAEAHLLSSGRSGLVPVYRDANVAIFELPAATPLLVAPPGERAAVLKLGHASLALRVSGPGRYTLAINYTPYWRVSPSASACVAQAPDGFSELLTARAGTIHMRFDPTLRQMLVESVGEGTVAKCTPYTLGGG